MLALTKSQVRSLVPMPDAIELMKQAFSELSAGRTVSPLRTVIPLPDREADALFMPGFVPAMDALGLKSVNVFRNNPHRGLPAIHALVMLVDTETGQPSAIMDGSYLTALRTGAVSGAAADLLARPDSRTLAVIGAGAQGVTQIAAICAVRPIERVIAVDVNEAALERLQRSVRDEWPDLAEKIEISLDAPSAVRQADVVCTATTSRNPVFADSDLKPGTHVSGVGAYTPEMQEVPGETVARATVVVDAMDAALEEGGDLIIPLKQGLVAREHYSRELGQLVNGNVTGRTSDEAITFFKSVGNAVQDVVVAKRAAQRAQEMGIGVEIDLAL